MPLNVTRPYKLGKKKKIIRQYLLREISQTEAAAAFGITRQNFPLVIATMMRQMVKDDEAFLEAFLEALRRY